MKNVRSKYIIIKMRNNRSLSIYDKSKYLGNREDYAGMNFYNTFIRSYIGAIWVSLK